jgi:NhaP-type Na+/H+ or K+/H+ antiporter
MHNPLVGLASVLVLGIGAYWLAWRLRVPAILLLLLVGFLAGPVTGLIEPDELLGRMMFPIVSLSVALILFEGGMSLRPAELREIGRPLFSLLTIGVLVTWMLTTLLAWRLLELPLATSLLLGAILVVTGPTVVGPLLAHIRPLGKVGPVASWEGIMIDPIGAVLAVLVFEVAEAVQQADVGRVGFNVAMGLVVTLLIGTSLAAVGTFALVVSLKRRWIPDFLQAPMVFAAVVAAFAASNVLQHESGLLTVTLMGLLIANQNWVYIPHVIQFKENLRVLLISSLFILLAARVPLDSFFDLGWQGPAFVALMIVFVRPLSVLLSTFGTALNWRERAFLAWMAPRGIVAASVSSVFAIALGEPGQGLVPATFLVIVGTVVVYGLTAPWLARRLRLSTADPQGVLLVSAHAGARAIAHALQAEGFRVVLVDTNRQNVNQARLEGLPSYQANILSENVTEELDLSGIGRLLSLTPNDEVNSLAAEDFAELFGRDEVYQLAPERRGGTRIETAPYHLRGRLLFATWATYDYFDRRFAEGAAVKATPLTVEFDHEAYLARHGQTALPMFLVSNKRLTVLTADSRPRPRPGQTLIALVDPVVAPSQASQPAETSATPRDPEVQA